MTRRRARLRRTLTLDGGTETTDAKVGEVFRHYKSEIERLRGVTYLDTTTLVAPHGHQYVAVGKNGLLVMDSWFEGQDGKGPLKIRCTIYETGITD